MKKNKLIAITLLGALTLASCGDGTQYSQNGEHKATIIPLEEFKQEKVEIDFWHAIGHDGILLIDDYVDSFNKIYPNVTVRRTSKGDYDGLLSAVTTAIIGGGDLVPDLVQGYPDHLADYLNVNRVTEISPFINSEDPNIGMTGDFAHTDFIKNFRDELNISNPRKNNEVGIYGVPHNKSTEVMFYNKTVLEKVGFDIPEPTAWTWEDVIEASVKIRTYKNPSGVLEYADSTSNGYLPFSWDSEGNAFITLGMQFGGKYSSAEGNTMEDHVLFDDDENYKKAILWYMEQTGKGYFNVPSFFAGGNYSSDFFKNQRLFMTISSTAGSQYNLPATSDPTKGGFEVGVASIPQFAGAIVGNELTGGATKLKKVVQQGPSLSLLWKEGDDHSSEIVRGYDLKRQAAYLFMRHLTSSVNTADYSMKTGYTASRASSVENEDYKNWLNFNDPTRETYYKSQAVNRSFDQTEYMFYTDPFSNSSFLRAQAELAFVSLVQDATACGPNCTTSSADYDEAIDILMNNVKETEGV